MPHSRNRSDLEVAKVSATGDRESDRHFTHFDASGQAHMVDVGDKEITRRVARAGGRITMTAATLAMIRDGSAKKYEPAWCVDQTARTAFTPTLLARLADRGVREFTPDACLEFSSPAWDS